MTDEDDYDIDELPCPKCGHSETRSRHCTAIHCDDGFIDEYEEDAINYAPGEEYTECQECHGTGIQRWCPECGADYWVEKAKSKQTAGD